MSFAISIHALVKRATERKAIALAEKAISIHALVKRATISPLIMVKVITDFNPRPREEGDQFSQRRSII